MVLAFTLPFVSISLHTWLISPLRTGEEEGEGMGEREERGGEREGGEREGRREREQELEGGRKEKEREGKKEGDRESLLENR